MQHALLEEYKGLRAEILQWQSQRIRVLSLSVTAMAGILALFGGLLLNTDINSKLNLSQLSIIGSVSLYTILIPLEVTIASSHRQIRRIAAYIRLHIEPIVPGLSYERKLLVDRDTPKPRIGMSSLGKSCVILTLIPFVLPAIQLSIVSKFDPIFLIIVPFWLIAFYIAIDLWFAFSKKWKVRHWENIDIKA